MRARAQVCRRAVSPAKRARGGLGVIDLDAARLGFTPSVPAALRRLSSFAGAGAERRQDLEAAEGVLDHLRAREARDGRHVGAIIGAPVALDDHTWRRDLELILAHC